MVSFLSVGSLLLRPVLFINNLKKRDKENNQFGGTVSLRIKRRAGNEGAGPSCAIKWQMLLGTGKCKLLHV